MKGKRTRPHSSRRRKPKLSGHQKTIRFFTRAVVVLIIIATIYIFKRLGS